jgi:L-seryl-tRNA(Ser) seleniumtransferase
MPLNKTEALRGLPAVDELLRCDELTELRSAHSHDSLVGWIRSAITEIRTELLGGREKQFEDLQQEVVNRIVLKQQSDGHRQSQPVINATGILLHTNLGRSPLAKQAVERMQRASAYTNLELNLESGKRSSRARRVSELLARLTGAEDAIVVNNCAAATMLALQATSAGSEVIISRGQLVEIGGGFRLPEVFQAAGVRLREVGTTNRTYLADYATALSEQSGAVLHVHRSNFTQSGFVTEPTIPELVSLTRPETVAVIDDNGSGNMFDLSTFGLNEPIVTDSVSAGSDLCLFSGDKLFGGPQAGIIVGKKRWVERLRNSPMMRALRADKVTLAALEATVEIHLAGNAFELLPIFQMLSMEAESIRANCLAIQQQLAPLLLSAVEVIDCQSEIGGGTLPGQTLASYGLAIKTERLELMARALRTGKQPILCRLHDDRLILDLRTVAAAEVEPLRIRLDELLCAQTAETT